MAYFSMECGLGEGLPLYAGGLGILAGDFLKTASDLGVPVVGVSLLYQRGYFRQMLDTSGRQQEVYAYNDPSSLPIQPVLAASGGWLHVSLELPGRILRLRVWQACVGRVVLYLLDSNDPLNSPTDRGITSELYGGGVELRLMQEIVLGLGGWRLLEALGLDVEVCHLNEGHAAFVVLERARSFMAQHGMSFWEALWATRAGNVFTTHTPVAAGFDIFAPELLDKYFRLCDYLAQLGISLADLLALGRRDPHEAREPFNMAYLAMRGCAIANGVSRLHGAVSRQLFSPLYPRWPSTRCPWATSPMACTPRAGTRPGRMGCGPTPAARNAGVAQSIPWSRPSRRSPMRSSGPATLGNARIWSVMPASAWPGNVDSVAQTRGGGAGCPGPRSQRLDPGLCPTLYRIQASQLIALRSGSACAACSPTSSTRCSSLWRGRRIPRIPRASGWCRPGSTLSRTLRCAAERSFWRTMT